MSKKRSLTISSSRGKKPNGLTISGLHYNKESATNEFQITAFSPDSSKGTSITSVFLDLSSAKQLLETLQMLILDAVLETKSHNRRQSDEQ